ncbi:unnamed protein product [Cuscuta campestris]|uniref:RING-type E3 ubiquitin transferase n=1 Tax=Cuscuta campestris TaxID=132261 RepID=A0A484K2F5_9ASTE|nr:unnamed protein product [Cuscuta campestris]
MEESEAGRYWCYQCLKMVNPILEEVEALTCPVCLTGFLELRESAVESGDASSPDLSQMLAAVLENLRELYSVVLEGRGAQGDRNGDRDVSRGSASALVETLTTESPNLEMEGDRMARNGLVGENGSVGNWDDAVPGAVRGPPPARILNVLLNPGRGDDVGDRGNEGENDLTLRFAVSVLRTLRAIRTETPTEPLNPEGDNSDDGDAENDENNGTSAAAAIIQLLQNQVNETLSELPNPDEGSRGRNGSNRGNGQRQIGTFGDYFLGPNFDAIMELLAENDRNQYGTPPARKDAVAGLPDVTVEDDLYPNGSSGSCTVCFEEFRAGTVVKEMPCKHRFHSDCILPWLDLHSSCPVCRYRLPTEEESKPEAAERDDGSRDDMSSSSRRDGEESDGSGTRGGRRWVWGPFVWPF